VSLYCCSNICNVRLCQDLDVDATRDNTSN